MDTLSGFTAISTTRLTEMSVHLLSWGLRRVYWYLGSQVR